MSSFAKRMQGVATKLLDKFDERSIADKLQLVRVSEPVWDPALGIEVVSEEQVIDMTGVAVPYNESLVDGTTIQSGDIKVTIDNSVEPLQQDKVIIDGVRYSIVSITPFAYTGKNSTIAYSFKARR